MPERRKAPLTLVSTAGSRDEIFNERPITLPGWRLSHRRATPLGTPSLKETQHALEFTTELHGSSPFWRADIVAYVSAHAAWGEKASQVFADTGYAAQTAYNVASVMRRVDQAERELAPSFEHARIVAPLEKAAQRKCLTLAVEKGWGKRELEKAVKAMRQRTVVDGHAETMHTVDLTVRLSLEAETPSAAETAAWDVVKRAIAAVPHSHVIAAHAQPHVGSGTRKKRAS